MDAQRFAKYFARGRQLCPVITVPGFTHPVQEKYLEDVYVWTTHFLAPAAPNSPPTCTHTPCCSYTLLDEDWRSGYGLRSADAGPLKEGDNPLKHNHRIDYGQVARLVHALGRSSLGGSGVCRLRAIAVRAVANAHHTQRCGVAQALSWCSCRVWVRFDGCWGRFLVQETHLASGHSRCMAAFRLPSKHACSSTLPQAAARWWSPPTWQRPPSPLTTSRWWWTRAR